ncbi:MAG: ribosome-associated translation inhibitor RaiA [Bacteroidetes bacterium]|nr:MAG: ribosome-associated translation inhibitor RaiA [Bacteroidota bacterium]
MVVHTEAVHFKADAGLIDYVEKKVGKLDHFFDRIQGAQVMLKLENSGQVRDKIAEVILKVPGETIVVKDTHKTFEAAIDSACATLKRQLIKYKEKIRMKS